MTMNEFTHDHNHSLATLDQTTRLPADLVRQVTIKGAKLLSALDRIGFVHENRDGSMFGLRFSEINIWRENGVPVNATFHVDTERMYHFSPLDIAKPRIVAALQAVCKLPLWVMTKNGLVIAIELAPAQQAMRLPARADLDLGKRPKGELMAPIGESKIGPIWRPLPAIGHALITGTTGSGKSTWLHSAIAGLVTGAGPNKLRLVLVDPKRSELAPWANIPHRLGDIAYTVEQATQLMGDLVDEVDRRGEVLAGAGVRDIAGYNSQSPKPLPYILCIVDEALDLALTAGARSELAGHLKTISMRGRSTGVYLWLATQHAAAVTGLPRVVAVNLTTRLVFRVADGTAAHTAGCPGAQDLPPNRPGRMLAKLAAKPIEVQGYVLRDGVLKAIARTVSGQSPNVTTGPVLSEGEIALVRYAMERLGGAFIVNKLAAAGLDGWTKYKVDRLALVWERRGWLTRPAHRADPRRVTPELAALAGVVDVA